MVTKIEREALATIIEALTSLQQRVPYYAVSETELEVRRELARELRKLGRT